MRRWPACGKIDVNLVLIGYRGTGKSQLAKLLSQRLGMETLSTDAEIVRRAGCSIPDYVAANGWDKFRDLEVEVVRDASAQKRVILDTGGGAILRAENVAALKADGALFWLTASIETIVSRIQTDANRPSLTGKSFTDEVAEVLAERTPIYAAAADFIVSTDGRSPEDCAQEIASLFKARAAS